MTETIVKMDEAGRIVLPKTVRESLHLAKRSSFRLSVHGDAIELYPLEREVEIVEEDGILVVQNEEDFDAVEVLDEMRSER